MGVMEHETFNNGWEPNFTMLLPFYGSMIVFAFFASIISIGLKAAFLIMIGTYVLCFLPIIYVIVPIIIMNVVYVFNPDLSVPNIIKLGFNWVIKMAYHFWFINCCGNVIRNSRDVNVRNRGISYFSLSLVIF